MKTEKTYISMSKGKSSIKVHEHEVPTYETAGWKKAADTSKAKPATKSSDKSSTKPAEDKT